MLAFSSSPSSTYDKLVIPWCPKKGTYILKEYLEVNPILKDIVTINLLKGLICKLEETTIHYDFPTIQSNSKKCLIIFLSFLWGLIIG